MSKFDYKVWNLPVHSDDRGALTPIYFEELPFEPKRSYFLYDVKAARGGHAHKDEAEVFICVKGSFRARIHDGRQWHEFKMDEPGKAIYTDKMVWHEFDEFSGDAVMLALSSTLYNGTKEYIMEFEKFKALKG